MPSATWDFPPASSISSTWWYQAKAEPMHVRDSGGEVRDAHRCDSHFEGVPCEGSRRTRDSGLVGICTRLEWATSRIVAHFAAVSFIMQFMVFVTGGIAKSIGRKSFHFPGFMSGQKETTC